MTLTGYDSLCFYYCSSCKKVNGCAVTGGVIKNCDRCGMRKECRPEDYPDTLRIERICGKRYCIFMAIFGEEIRAKVGE